MNETKTKNIRTKIINKRRLQNKQKEQNEKYIKSIGRRKETTAIVKLYTRGSGKILIDTENKKGISLNELFGGNSYLIEDALYAFKLIGEDLLKKIDIYIKVRGGGIRGMAEAIRLGIARCLVRFNPDYKTLLKQYGLLKRDPREKERKKYGLKKARRAPQWSKR